jgi:hypothetical protein
MRDDPAVFAATVRGGRLAAWQEHELRASVVPGLISCWVWGRQSGKSERLADLALWSAMRAPGRLVLVISGGGQLGARRLLDTVSRVAASEVVASSVEDESSSVVRLRNGSEIRAVPASEHAIRGWAVDALIVDECQVVPDDLLYSAALPTVTARPDAYIVLAGTAGRAEGAFYDLSRRGECGEEGVRFSRRVSRLVGGEDAMPWQSPTLVARLMSAMGPVRADAEYRCLWSSGGDYLFSRADVDAVTADYRPDALGSLRGPAGVDGGLDLGLSRDQSAFVALGLPLIGGVGQRVVAVRCAHLWEPGYPVLGPDGAPSVFADVAGSSAVLDTLRVDATGMQAALLPNLVPLLRARRPELGGGQPRPRYVVVEEGPGGGGMQAPEWRRSPRGHAPVAPTVVRGVTFSSAMKQAAYGTLRLLVQRQAIVLPAAAVEMRRQLLALRVGLTRGGAETFDAEGGSHDDLPDSLILAMRPFKDAENRWRTVAGVMADRPYLEPPAPDGLWAAGAVETGGGLRLPALPTWASPNGRGGLSVPAEVVGFEDPNLQVMRAAVGAALDRGDEDDE